VARSKKGARATKKSAPKRESAARRRAGDAAEQARFRDGVRVRAASFKDKKREASRRACRGPSAMRDD
jgi:hypothetical protein